MNCASDRGLCLRSLALSAASAPSPSAARRRPKPPKAPPGQLQSTLHSAQRAVICESCTLCCHILCFVRIMRHEVRPSEVPLVASPAPVQAAALLLVVPDMDEKKSDQRFRVVESSRRHHMMAKPTRSDPNQVRNLRASFDTASS